MAAGTTFFGSVLPGTAKLVTLPTSVPAAVTFSVTPSFPDLDSAGILVTSIGYAGRGATQLMRTLGRALYVYSFGLREGTLMLSGTAFLRNCDGGSGSSGIVGLISYFEEQAEKGTILDVRLGGLSFYGLVDTLRSTWSDDRFGTSGFQLQMHAVSTRMRLLGTST